MYCKLYLGVKVKTIHSLPVIKIISSVMFAAGGNLEFVITITRFLKTFDIVNSILAYNQWIFPWSFLATAPSWISKHVHVGAPIRQTSQPYVVHCPCFCRYSLQYYIMK